LSEVESIQKNGKIKTKAATVSSIKASTLRILGQIPGVTTPDSILFPPDDVA
jgi:hypothetical protein